MLIHNFKLAWRNLQKQKSISLINLLGLTIGLCSCMIIGLYAFNELSFDKFHQDSERIFRVNKSTNEKGSHQQTDGISPGLLAPAAVKEIPAVELATRFRPWFNEMLVSHDSTRLKLDDVVYADASFLKLFNFPLTKGSSDLALSDPFRAVITESTAKKFFGDKDPIGQTLITLNNIPVTVSGLAKDVPTNSSIRFNILISWATIEAPANQPYFSWMNNWRTQVNFTFLKLRSNTSPEKVATRLSEMMHKERPDDEFEYRPFLQPLPDIHLHSKNIQYAGSFVTNNGNIVNTLLVIAAFLLLIAAFNFINLATANALGRSKETGVQKVLGAQKWQLVYKYFSESLLICLLSMILALFLSALLLSSFNKLAGTHLESDLLFRPKALLSWTFLLFIISILAGLYPSVFLARYRSTDVFRNIVRAGKDGWIRKGLVTTQFAMSVLLIVATLVVNLQIRYITNKDLGFEKDQVVVIPLTNTGIELNQKSHAFIADLKNLPGILSVSAGNRVPGQEMNAYGIIPEGHRLEEHMISNVLESDADFLNTYKIDLSQGRYFSPEFPTDTANAIVINEAMAQMLNWKNPVGKKLEIFEARKGEVIGVVKDFHYASLRENIQPLAFMLNDNPMYVSARIAPGMIPRVIESIRHTWTSYDQEYPFDYFFLDQQLSHYYESDTRLLEVLSVFAGLAILIACLGLFGLSMYNARTRTKEIGIRKVLGASIPGIVKLLSRDFLWLVVIASLIALPVSWWLIHQWLQDFAFRVEVHWWVFAGAGLMAFIIAFLTISFQSLKAARANPTKSLRTE